MGIINMKSFIIKDAEAYSMSLYNLKWERFSPGPLCF